MVGIIMIMNTIDSIAVLMGYKSLDGLDDVWILVSLLPTNNTRLKWQLLRVGETHMNHNIYVPN